MDIEKINQKTIKVFQQILIDFYFANGRHDLPWRSTSDPWQILLSEMLLRKTTAKQAERSYLVLSELPIKQIADMELELLENLIKPLGIYHERARLLKDAAAAVQKAGKNALEEEEFLKKIKGAGSYAVNAVQCFAFGRPKPALDRNMIRILDRVLSIKSDKNRPHTDQKLWHIAEILVPQKYPKEYNWGILDLSAMLCRPKNPKCSECPLLKICFHGKVNLSEKLT